MNIGDIFEADKLQDYIDYANAHNLIIDRVETREDTDADGNPYTYNIYELKSLPEPTEEEIKQSLRFERISLLEAFDVWEKAVMRGREEDNEEIMAWYQQILDLNEDAINNVPERIQYYISRKQ